jgi:hypothetical protein
VNSTVKDLIYILQPLNPIPSSTLLTEVCVRRQETAGNKVRLQESVMRNQRRKEMAEKTGLYFPVSSQELMI